jgi:hypothetical protein
MRWLAAAIAGCVLVIAWAVHDLSKTWADSLRLPEGTDD